MYQLLYHLILTITNKFSNIISVHVRKLRPMEINHFSKLLKDKGESKIHFYLSSIVLTFSYHAYYLPIPLLADMQREYRVAAMNITWHSIKLLLNMYIYCSDSLSRFWSSIAWSACLDSKSCYPNYDLAVDFYFFSLFIDF